MPTKIELRGPVDGTPIFVIVAAVLLLVFWFVFLLLRTTKKVKKVEAKPEPLIQTDFSVYQKSALEQIGALEKQWKSQAIDGREAHQKMSMILREYVDSVMGTKTKYMALHELRTLGRDDLTKLIEEYYEPEFSEQSQKDVSASIQNTIKVIKAWK